LNLAKCHFAAAELPFLGHILGRFGLKMDLVKVQKLKSIKLPTNKKTSQTISWPCRIF